MVLEYTTLFVLLVVVLTRYFTTRHKNGLQLEQTTLEDQHSKLQGDYNSLSNRRKATEKKMEGVRSARAVLENELEELNGELDDLIDRNEEMEEG